MIIGNYWLSKESPIGNNNTCYLVDKSELSIIIISECQKERDLIIK